jgi:hypothetical protein
MPEEKAGDSSDPDGSERAICRVSRSRTQAGYEADATAFRQRAAQTEQVDGPDRSREGEADGEAFEQMLHLRIW